MIKQDTNNMNLGVMVTLFSSARTAAPSDARERSDDDDTEAGAAAMTNKYRKYRVVQ